MLVDWLPQRDLQSLNFLNANGFLPLRDEAQSRLEVIAAPQSSTLLHGINLEDHMNPGSGLDDENNNTTLQHPELGQVMDINLSSWNEFYPTDSVVGVSAESKVRHKQENNDTSHFLSVCGRKILLVVDAEIKHRKLTLFATWDPPSISLSPLIMLDKSYIMQ
ncbi:hypothetical protein ACE6H2_004325 [Prunus campanulata]